LRRKNREFKNKDKTVFYFLITKKKAQPEMTVLFKITYFALEDYGGFVGAIIAPCFANLVGV
jgi:hypothetical protein